MCQKNENKCGYIIELIDLVQLKNMLLETETELFEPKLTSNKENRIVFEQK